MQEEDARPSADEGSALRQELVHQRRLNEKLTRDAVEAQTAADEEDERLLAELNARAEALESAEERLKRTGGELSHRAKTLERREQEVAERERSLAAREAELATKAGLLAREARTIEARAPEPAVERLEPSPEAAVAAQGINLDALERTLDERAEEFPDRVDEWRAYIVFLREFVHADGDLPSTFNTLVREVFRQLLV
jgi:uncharacterized protein (DUF3084 family)